MSFTEESKLDSDNFTDAHLGGLGIGIVSSRGGSLEFLINDSEDVNEGVRIDTFAGSGKVRSYWMYISRIIREKNPLYHEAQAFPGHSASPPYQ